jgi:hypothetical protein
MMQDQFRLYPRGFLGDFTNKPITYMNDASVALMLLQRNSETMPQRYKMLGLPNQKLDQLYQSLLSAPTNMERFAWREELLKVAVKAFGTSSLALWLKAQSASAYCGKHHKNFISDCLRFASGRDREQAISSWLMLIGDEDTSAEGKMPTMADHFMFNGKSIDQATIADLIQAWCSQERGYSDMAVSLNILFGRYDGLY